MIRLMLADDSRDMRQSMTSYFSRKKDIEIVGTAADGREAEKLLRERLPDVLLLDLVMPGMDGISLLKHISADGLLSRVKVIVLSGILRDLYVQKTMRLGAYYYMMKPCDPQLLLERVRELCQEAEGEEEPRRPDPIAAMARALGRFCVPSACKGYQYLLHAGDLLGSDLCHPAKFIYPELSARLNVTPASVERAIRSAIETGWKRGMNRLGVFPPDRRPSNGAFLTKLSEEMKTR